MSSYEGFQVGTTSVVDVGNGVVLAKVNQGGHLRGGSAELQEDFAFIYEWTDGLVVRVTVIRAEGDSAAAERLAEERG